MSTCRICGGRVLTAFEAREMFLGTREPFGYDECADCGTLQRADVPVDLSALYSTRYFDFAPPAVPEPVVDWLRGFAGVSVMHSVLDVGCATGALPTLLARLGIRAVGIDPYAPVTRELAQARGWEFRRSLDEVTGHFDVVLASHVLEHAPDLRGMLRALVTLLAPEGRLVVMMPFACSPLAAKYGPTWIGLDPGRHLHVLTRSTFVTVARQAGLEVLRQEDQTLALNCAVSEAWAAGLSFADFASRPSSVALVSRFEEDAAALRRAGQGDAWAFALRRTAP
jgi:SAM-dependent methyltransferase